MLRRRWITTPKKTVIISTSMVLGGISALQPSTATSTLDVECRGHLERWRGVEGDFNFSVASFCRLVVVVGWGCFANFHLSIVLFSAG